MTSSITYLVIGLFLGFGIGALWVIKRGINRLGEPPMSHLRKVKNEDTGEPINDVDRRMAYGAYEDALSVIKSAIIAEPNRSDLKFKALEILFVWGKGEKFLAFAKENQHDLKASNDWPRVCILAGEICPNERLFAAATE